MKFRLLLTLLIFFCFSLFANNNRPIKAVGFASHPAIQNHYVKIVKNAYLNIGLEPDFIPVSDKRSIKMLNENKLDGLVVRTDNILSQYPDFIAVPPLLGVVEISLVCQQGVVCDADLFDDKNKILGLVAQEEYYRELLDNKQINIYEVGDYQRMERMFAQKKLDAMIMVFDLNTQGKSFLQLNRFTLEQRQGFHIINKRFSHLIPKLSQALAKSLAAHDFNPG